jgi:hypothetical protein
MSDEYKRTPVGIRINRDLLYEAKLAAVRERISLGRWLEDAILGKIQMSKITTKWD